MCARVFYVRASKRKRTEASKKKNHMGVYSKAFGIEVKI